MFWKALKVSPALLGASLLVASSAYAAQNVSGKTETAATSASAVALNSTAAETSNSATEPTSVEVSSTLNLASSNLAEPTVATDMAQPSVDALERSQVMPVGASEGVQLANSILGEPTPANSNSELLQQIQQYNDGEAAQPLDQVTNVGQLRDVSPGDWAYEALRSLVERYGCIAGYPDGTYRGNRAMTRYEFAAGLNACLQQIERLIGPTDGPGVEDLATLRRLIEEFQAELTTLGARVDNLEGRVAFLEDHQFSTTTKFKGEVIFALGDAWGDERALPSGSPDNNPDLEVNTNFTDRVRLSLDTSFTGKDTLRTRLQARNVTPFGTNVTGTNMTRSSFDGSENNDVAVDKLWYRFPLGDKLRIQIDATGAEFYDNIIDTVNPFFQSSGAGSISRFGRFNPIYRTGGDVGGALTYNFSKSLAFSAAYFANDGEDPSEDRGLFNGTYSALGQLTFKPTDAITLGLTYVHSYYSGSVNAVNVTGSTGSGFANRPFGATVATSSDSYGIQGNVKFGKFSVGGWIGYQDAEAEATALEGQDADIWNWAVNLALLDVGGAGNMLGLVVGMPPKVTDNDVNAREDNDTSYHIEALYRYKLSDNIAITPGVLVILNPEHNDNNDTIWVGTLRTTFTF